jgi:type IV secretion system protein VirB9
MNNKILISAILSLPLFGLALDKPVQNNTQAFDNKLATNQNVVIKKPDITANTTSGVDVKKVTQAPKLDDSTRDNSKIQKVIYDPNKVITIYANPFVTTTIEFSKNEVVNGNNITNGDNSSWLYETYIDKPNYLGLKPSRVGSDTSMTVVTNKHTYYIHLISTDKLQAMYAVQFQYPLEELKAINAKRQYIQQQEQADLSEFRNPAEYNMNYTFNGDKNIMPIQVWDDGKVTYMQFSPNQPQPAIFAVQDKTGDEAVVNYRRLKNDLVMVMRVAPQFTLRLGSKQVASIFNQTYIEQIKHNESNYHNKGFFKSAMSYFQADDIAEKNQK